MKLSDKDVEKFNRHLDGFRCPQCGHPNAYVFKDLYSMPSLSPEERFGTRFVGDEFMAYNLLMASCARCGMVSFFDPATVGISPDNAWKNNTSDSASELN